MPNKLQGVDSAFIPARFLYTAPIPPQCTSTNRNHSFKNNKSHWSTRAGSESRSNDLLVIILRGLAFDRL
jgi:hypothetical protein